MNKIIKILLIRKKNIQNFSLRAVFHPGNSHPDTSQPVNSYTRSIPIRSLLTQSFPTQAIPTQVNFPPMQVELYFWILFSCAILMKFAVFIQQFFVIINYLCISWCKIILTSLIFDLGAAEFYFLSYCLYACSCPLLIEFSIHILLSYLLWTFKILLKFSFFFIKIYSKFRMHEFSCKK